MSIKTHLTVCGRPAAFIVVRTYGWKDVVEAAPPHADWTEPLAAVAAY